MLGVAMVDSFNGQVERPGTAGPRVTIVVATYNRPKSLRLAIASVFRQTLSDWQLLIIGDCCHPGTEESIGKFKDERIRFINLPERCGEQSGPNSVGMALAKTPFVAFLNHDDFWFADHLETGLTSLQAHQADFYAGRAVFAKVSETDTLQLEFPEVSPSNRELNGVFQHKLPYFEPASSWILSRAACDAVGPWQWSNNLYRTPLQDWVLRAWRCGLRFADGNRVSVIKLRLMRGYGEHPEALSALDQDLSTDEDGVRRRIQESIDARGGRSDGSFFAYRYSGDGRIEDTARLMLDAAAAERFVRTGFDAFDEVCARHGIDRGTVLREALARRTGERLSVRPDLQRLIADANKQLSDRADPPDSYA